MKYLKNFSPMELNEEDEMSKYPIPANIDINNSYDSKTRVKVKKKKLQIF